MGKKILYIVLGALIVFGLLFLLWSWLAGTPAKNTTDGGSLGSAGDTTQTATGGTNSNNGQTPIGSNAGAIGAGSYNAQGVYVGPGNGTYDSNGNYVGMQNGQSTIPGSGTGGGTITIGTVGDTTGGFTTVPGVTWIGSPFNPADINSISSGAGGFVPTITSQTGASGSGTSLLTVLAGTAIAGTVSCAIQAGIATLATGGAGAAVAPALASPPGAIAIVAGTGGGPLIVADYGARAALGLQVARNAGKDQVTFLGCIVNVVAKAALAQITASVVNWINSGFNGQPSFVTDYQQFFTNVADLAAGQFIQGAGLSFLCSPFKLQIQIAIAQSYANRNAQSCTLTKVIGNVNSFMNGNFAQGGWGGFVSVYHGTTNNPYGAFAYAQAGLASQQSQALANAKSNISPTGFLNLQQLSGCDVASNNGISGGASLGINPQAAVAAGKAALPSGCKAKVITPGGAIADSLGAVSKSGVDQLGLANSLDQIINALTTQLMVKILQNGLPSLSQSTTQTPADIAAQSQALTLLNDMQSRTTFAQQIGAIAQGSIADIESAQAGLNGLANCWSSIAASTDASAAQKAASANTTLLSLNDQITAYNNTITRMNDEIAMLNQFETRVSTASSAGDIATITANYNAAVAAGSFASQADITTAQQNRTTLQSQMATINQSTQTGLAQCNAAQ